MFDQLVESQPVRARSPMQFAISIAAHTAIIAISIQLTRAVAESVVKRPIEVDMHLARPPLPAPPPRSSAPAMASSSSAASAPAIMPVAPIVVPTSIPPVDLGQHFDPKNFNGNAIRGDAPFAPAGPAGDPSLPLAMDQVDEAVVYLQGPSPVYPPALRQVGVEGSVTLRYVVGIDGRVESASIVVLQSTNRAFEAPAIDAITAAKFKAARIRGHAVRQLVEQVVRFTLGRP